MSEDGDWMEKLAPKLKHGALHRELGIPEGQDIPVSTLEEAAKKGGKLGARARLALKFRRANRGKK